MYICVSPSCSHDGTRTTRGKVRPAPVSHNRLVEVSFIYEHASTDTQDTAPRLGPDGHRQMAAL
jgi:hypothetical protein